MAWTKGLVAGAVRAGGQMHRPLGGVGDRMGNHMGVYYGEIIWEYTMGIYLRMYIYMYMYIVYIYVYIRLYIYMCTVYYIYMYS